MTVYFVYPVVLGIIAGTIARLLMLRTDFRQYPTYPHGQIIHIALGFIAAFIGSAAVPAVLSQDWSAVTFLGLAAQQFRDVRNMERNTLQNIDQMELVPRGAAYIEGTARVFEGRNYLVMFTASVTTLVATLASLWWGVLAAGVMFVIDRWKMSGKSISHIAHIHAAAVTVTGADVVVDDIYIMNVGLKENQEIIKKRALGVILVPKDANGIVTLANLGQRQAILHDVSNILGVYRDSGEPAFVPIAKRDMENGRIALFLLPQEIDMEKVKMVIAKVPILESAVRLPKEAAANYLRKRIQK